MSQAFMSPADFAIWTSETGFATSGGNVKLNRYLSASESNHGSYTSQDLCSILRGMMMKTNTMPGFKNYTRISTGQGYINDFVLLWNWMYAHLDMVRTIKFQGHTAEKNPAGDGYVKVPTKFLDLSKVFREGRAFPEAMAELVDNGCFGWDCIGFVSQYLITIGHLDEYKTWYSNDYLVAGNFKPITGIDNITPCCVLVFGTWHIVLVSDVEYVVLNESTGSLSAKVTVAQSYTGGPKARYGCVLTQFPNSKTGGWSQPVNQTGVLDNSAQCTVGRNSEIEICYPPYSGV